MSKEIDKYIEEHQKNLGKSSDFVSYLYYLMDKYGFDNPSALYNKAGISRQLWSSIISNKSHPSLEVCIKLAFALGVTNHQCKLLLKKAGYTLPSCSKYSLIIRYCIENKIYDLYKVEEILNEYGYTDTKLF